MEDKKKKKKVEGEGSSKAVEKIPQEYCDPQSSNLALDSLINSYRAATKRTRRIFLTINLTTIMLMISFFNYRLSWSRHQHKFDEVQLNNLEINPYSPKIDDLVKWCSDDEINKILDTLEKKKLIYAKEVLQDIKKEGERYDFKKSGRGFVYKLTLDTSIVIGKLIDNEALQIDTKNGSAPRVMYLLSDSIILNYSSPTQKGIGRLGKNLVIDKKGGGVPKFAPEQLFMEFPILGIKIYVQDIPFLGGITVLLILYWFYKARKLEASLHENLKEKIKDTSGNNLYKEIIEQELNINTVFKPRSHTSNPINFRFFIKYIEIIRKEQTAFLFYAPILFLILFMAFDIVENYIYGPWFQRCLCINKGQYHIHGVELDYFLHFFDIPSKLVCNNISTFKYAKIVESHYEHSALFMQAELVILNLISIIVIYLCFKFSNAILSIIENEKQN